MSELTAGNPLNIKRIANVLDIGGVDITQIALDASSYMWVWGNSNTTQNLTGGLSGQGTVANRAQSSPTMAINDRQYIKLAKYMLAALNASSYAWTWGDNSSGRMGVNRDIGDGTGAIGIPQSVVGGKQWLELKGSYTQSGNMFTVGMDLSSYLWAWGANSGRLGDNTVAARSSPVSVVGNRRFIKYDIGCNGTFVCALDTSSYAWTWGLNTNGQLGDGTILTNSSPISVLGAKKFIDVFAANSSCFGMDSLSYLWAWGLNSNYLLGDGTNTDRSSPVSVLGGPWDQFFACASTVFAKKTNANFYYVWGTNTVGQFGNNSVIPTSDVIFSAPKVYFPFKIKKILGNTTMMALDTNSTVWTWGANTGSPNFGGVGDGTVINRSVYTQPLGRVKYDFFSSPTGLRKLLMAYSNIGLTTNCLLLDQSSYAWTWGAGNNTIPATFTPSLSPLSVVGNKQWISINIFPIFIGATGFAVIGLDSLSYAWAWGDNTYGQLGNGAVGSMSSPVSVIGGKQWRKVLANNSNCIAIDSSSYVWCWGNGSFGALGNNTILSVSSPISVFGAKQALDIAATGPGTFALLDSSSYVWTWGSNSGGQLGINTTTSVSSPVSVVGNRIFTKIVGNNELTGGSFYGLDSSSYMWAWGSGDLGDNNAVSRSSPVSVVGGRQFINIGCACAINASSYLWTWGDNSSGRLGDGTLTNKISPVSVIGGYQFVDFACGHGVANYPSSSFLYWGACSNYYASGLTGTYNNKGLEFVTTDTKSPVVTRLGHQYPRMYGSSGSGETRKNILGK